MKRYFYISEDLDDLAVLEKELKIQGVTDPQIHILSKNDAAIEQHHLNEVHDFMKKDVVHTTLKAALLGMGVAILAILISLMSGIPEAVGWLPFASLSIILLGFCTWEGGMLGIQKPNSRFRQFQEALQQGMHVLVIDAEAKQHDMIQFVTGNHPKLEFAGTGSPAPGWVVHWRQRWTEFLHWAP